jgi:hypothetical protein
MVRVLRKARYRRVIVFRIRYVIFMDCSYPYRLIFWILFLYQGGKRLHYKKFSLGVWPRTFERFGIYARKKPINNCSMPLLIDREIKKAVRMLATIGEVRNDY